MEYVKFDKIDNGYLIKETGKVVTKDELGKLKNRQGIDEFVHLGYVYSKQIHNGKIVFETETETIIELDVTREKADILVDEEPELNPYILNAIEAETLLPPLPEGDSGVTG